ncbi:MAG: hypothetical protein QM401_07365 [Bacillota bacterium]|nr:hypothetical protein [Bacillota bacterium]
MENKATITTIIADHEERIEALEKKVAALERQLEGQPDMDVIFSEMEKRLIQQLSKARDTFRGQS